MSPDNFLPSSKEEEEGGRSSLLCSVTCMIMEIMDTFEEQRGEWKETKK